MLLPEELFERYVLPELLELFEFRLLLYVLPLL